MKNYFDRVEVGDRVYLKKHIGKTFIINQGYIAKIIGGGSKKGYVTIKINDWVKEVRYSALKKGQIKYPYHPTVYNIGYLGEGQYKPVDNKGKVTKSYRTWMNMFTRCYNQEYIKKFPTYKDVTICEEWHNFQNFAQWYEKQYKEDDWQLDKDLLSDNAKIYSPETCCFIPPLLNTLFSNSHSKNTSGFTGVSYNNRQKKWVAQLRYKNKLRFHAYYDTKEEAIKNYNEQYIKILEEIIEEYKNILPIKILNKIKDKINKIKFKIPQKPKINLREKEYAINLVLLSTPDRNSCVYNMCVSATSRQTGLFRDDKEIAKRALRTIRRFSRLLALRDQECPDSRGFNNPRWGDNVHYIVYNREAYDGIENPYEIKSTIHRIPECAVLFKTEKDARKICAILNSGGFNLEGE